MLYFDYPLYSFMSRIVCYCLATIGAAVFFGAQHPCCAPFIMREEYDYAQESLITGFCPGVARLLLAIVGKRGGDQNGV